MQGRERVWNGGVGERSYPRVRRPVPAITVLPAADQHHQTQSVESFARLCRGGCDQSYRLADPERRQTARQGGSRSLRRRHV